ncbi:MAG: beta-ketoacyl-ACP synthase III [Candidatus Auribacterota bacterium]|nr:beta-ketoacyl-ACP synthase III [Candidatus Auribacterota bacterium]
MEKKSGIKIVGTGSFLPEKVLTNHDIEKIVDTSDEWIVTRSGISERRIIDDSMATSDMASIAAKRALDNAGLKPEDLDFIIVATVTADHYFPSTACLVQKNIGAVNAAACDVSAACSGFVYSLVTGIAFLNSKVGDRIMVIGAEALSRITDWEDRSTCVLFGDGAGALIIERCEKGSEVLYFSLGADGTGSDLLEIPAGGSRKPASMQTVENREHYIKMKGNELFKWAVKKMRDLVADAIKQSGLTKDSLTYVIPHQVNIRIIDAALKRLKVPIEKVVLNLDKYGNTSAASIPIALDELNREGKLKKGDNIIFVAFGSGLTWASCVMKW